MDVSFRSVALNKRYPLRISRGEFSGSVNLFVSVGSGDLEGLGEAAPGSLIGTDTAESFQVELTSFLEDCPEALDNPHEGWQLARSA
ncbi:MAG: dipeptide epimerase, partial [Pseudomonadota bacterium]